MITEDFYESVRGLLFIEFVVLNKDGKVIDLIRNKPEHFSKRIFSDEHSRKWHMDNLISYYENKYNLKGVTFLECDLPTSSSEDFFRTVITDKLG